MEARPAGRGVKAPTLREARFEDYAQIAALEASVGLIPRPHERWIRLWQGNPAYDDAVRWPLGWVLEADGKIVGSIGNVPLLYQLHGRTILAATFVGWAVDPDYRAFSLMLVTHQRQHPDVELQLVTTAGPMPEQVFTRLGWSRVPVGRWDRSALWVTSYAGSVRSYLNRKLPRGAALAANFILRAPLRLADASCRAPDLHARCDLRWQTTFGSEFDQFWHARLESEPTVLLASRSARAMNWHFGYGLAANEVWILTAREHERLVAYAILQRKDSPALGLTRMMLIDVQSLATDRELAPVMLSSALRRAREEGIHVVENGGCWFEALYPSKIRASRHRLLDSWCYLYRPGNATLTKALEDPAAWNPTQYDGDASL